MKKSFLIITALCLISFQADAKDYARKLERKIAEIEHECAEDIRKIEVKAGLSPEMKQLRIRQKNEKKELEIKQVKEKYELKTRQKSERKALKEKEQQKSKTESGQEAVSAL